MELPTSAKFLGIRQRLGRVARTRKLRAIYRKYRDATMIREGDFIANLELAWTAMKDPKLTSGAIVECGTWKGGMSAALIEIGGPGREYHFFDSFEGLPPAEEIDGARALAWQSDTTSPCYFDNCSASRDEFVATISRTGMLHERVHIHIGFFDKTLASANVPGIAVLRLDGDWYDSTMTCLEHLFDKVLPGGIVLIDDYYAWEGCSRAIHDFLSARSATEQIRTASEQLAFLTKTGD
ncbi:MAG: O-methyltransferase [Sphingomonadales bacterium]|jgi:hypothetical protein|nr:O-methyltransferase [Sphingomonadales bacterium]